MWLFALMIGTTPLPLETAVRHALAAGQEMKSAQSLESEARSKRAASTASLLPRLRVEGGVQWWDSPFGVHFVNPSDLPQNPSSLPPAYAPFIPLLEGLAKPTNVRNQLTANIGATLAQPLVALYPLIAARTAAVHEVGAVEAQSQRTEHDFAFRVVEAYAQALTAEAAQRTAEKGGELASLLLERAAQLHAAGLVARTELLRARANRASLDESLITAKAGVELSRAALQTMIRWPDSDFSLVSVAVPERTISLDEALREMRRTRPELHEIDHRLQQAEQGVAVAGARMLPDVTALANFTHNDGNVFAPENAFFVGAALGWDVWDWGARWHQFKAEQAHLQAARQQRSKVEDDLALEVRQALTRVTVAKENVVAAEAAAVAAEEFMKDEEGRFGAGQTTGTDLTLAQTGFLQAENNLSAARYRALVAAAALDRAMGKMPLGLAAAND